MCTAATYKTKDFYFGRTLDYEFSYGDEVTITPRNYQFDFHNGYVIKNHYAIIGMAYVSGDYPLYYDAVNEKGLGMAGLNFVGNAYYFSEEKDKDNIAQFEFIPWLLSQCATVKEAKKLLEKINITKFLEYLESMRIKICILNMKINFMKILVVMLILLIDIMNIFII